MTDDVHVLRLSLRQAQALNQAQAELRQAAEKDACATREALERIARALCPAAVDDLNRRQPGGLVHLSPDKIADLVIGAVRREIGNLRVERAVLSDVDPAELLSLREEVAALRAALAAAQQATPQTTQVQMPLPLPARPAPVRGLPPWRNKTVYDPPAEMAVVEEAWPEWARAWRGADKGFERSLDVILILGDTGLARRQDLIALIADRWNVTPGSGGIQRALTRLGRFGLVESLAARQEARGWKPGGLVRLSERGRDAYRLITGKEPEPSQASELLRRHKSPEHAALNIDVAEMLWAAGYEVELFPPSVVTGEGEFWPDLAARLEGAALYVEVERATFKNSQDRRRKWDLYHAVSGGHFAVAVASESEMIEIQREIVEWAGERPLTLWLTNLEQAGGQQGERIWLVKRRVP